MMDAVATGGAFVPVGAAIPTLAVARTGAPLNVWPVWPWFVLLALLTYVVDVWHRRRADVPRRLA